jgi:DNA-directed RNA polymerase specialized sigma24 family protein
MHDLDSEGEKAMANDSELSISQFVGNLKAGDSDAPRELWKRYSRDLVRLARARLGAISRAAADEEDVALSAFKSFCIAAARGQFPCLEDRDDLWKILVTITVRKAADLAQYHRRQKRGGGKVLASADLGGTGSRCRREGDILALIPGREPTPDFAIQVAEECRRLLDLLPNELRRQVALDRMAGYTEDEIAARLGCSRRTVSRNLALIRMAWRVEDEP